MTEDQKYEIAVLADDYSNKQRYYQNLGLSNVYGLAPEEATKRSIEYHLADAARIEAWSKLERAKLALAKP